MRACLHLQIYSILPLEDDVFAVTVFDGLIEGGGLDDINELVELDVEIVDVEDGDGWRDEVGSILCN